MARQTLGQRIAPARFLAFLVIFAIAFAASFAAVGWQRALMLGFDIAALFFLLAITPILRASGAATMKQHAKENDANRVILLVITSVTMIAILTAVFSELSVKDGDGPPKVFVVKDGKAAERPVQLGLTNGAYVEVVTGLQDGEQVVVVGQAAVKPGATVRIVNTPARPAARTQPAVAAG